MSGDPFPDYGSIWLGSAHSFADAKQRVERIIEEGK